MVEFKAFVAPLLQRLPGTEEQKLAIVVGGAALSAATLCCACGSRTAAPAVPAEVAATPTGSAMATPQPKPAMTEENTPAKERKRPAPVETGTPVASFSPRGRPSAEAVAEMLGRRQQVLDEIVAVDAECVRQLRALARHFVGAHFSAPLVRTTACWLRSKLPPIWLLSGPAFDVFNSTERHAIFGSTTPDKIAACHGLHEDLLRQLQAAVDALGAPAV